MFEAVNVVTKATIERTFASDVILQFVVFEFVYVEIRKMLEAMNKVSKLQDFTDGIS